MIEVVKDVAIAVAILCTVFYRSVDLLVWGQLWASVLTWIVIVCMAGRATGYGIRAMVMDLVPFAVAACAMWAVCAGLSWLVEVGWSGAGGSSSGVRLQSIVQLCVEVLGGGVVYLLVMKLGRFPELDEAAGYLFGRFRKTRR